MAQDPVYDELVKSIRKHDSVEVADLLSRTKLYPPAMILKAFSVVDEEIKKGVDLNTNLSTLRKVMNRAIFDHPNATKEHKNTAANQELGRLIDECFTAGVEILLKERGEHLTLKNIQDAMAVAEKKQKTDPDPNNHYGTIVRDLKNELLDRIEKSQSSGKTNEPVSKGDLGQLAPYAHNEKPIAKGGAGIA